jgi:hypothetical protein
METLGIDLSASETRTAACLVEWGPDSVHVKWIRTGKSGESVSDSHLVSEIRRVYEKGGRAGIDAPFGWPKPFLAAVNAWSDTAAPEPFKSDGPGYEPFRYRLTDLRRVAEGDRPLSVSSDLIGITAMRTTRILAELLDVDRSGLTGPVLEVYPAAALRHWGLPHRSYKGRKGLPRRIEIFKEINIALGGRLQIGEELAAECVRGDHALDALIASLVVRAATLNRTSGPAHEDLDIAKEEGWIHVPECGPRELVTREPSGS